MKIRIFKGLKKKKVDIEALKKERDKRGADLDYYWSKNSEKNGPF